MGRYVQAQELEKKHLEQHAGHAQAAASQILTLPLQGQLHTDVCWNRSATHLAGACQSCEQLKGFAKSRDLLQQGCGYRKPKESAGCWQEGQSNLR